MAAQQRSSSSSSNGVLCRYFFQSTFAEDGAAPAEQYTSSLLLSSEPTLGELRRKFPFEGHYHFRLQHPLAAPPSGKPAYCWLDLREPNHVLPVTKAPHSEIRVKVLQLSPTSEAETSATSKQQQQQQHALRDVVDIPEDRQFDAYFRPQLHSRAQLHHTQSQPSSPQDVSSVLSGVKKALASKMKQSAMAQSIQKQSVKMWEKVVTSSGSGASGSGSGSSASAPPTAAALAQLAKLISAMKTPLHDSSREHVELLHRLWVACVDTQPFALRGAAWERLGLRTGDPVRELQVALPLHCLVFFHEVHASVARPMLASQTAGGAQTYAYALVAAQVAFLLADVLQLADGACLGLERPFWRLFEDPIAFFELFSVAFRAFDESWTARAGDSATSLRLHLDYVADFVHELLVRRSPESVAALIDAAHEMQNW